jgi:nicotinamidase-related amidase
MVARAVRETGRRRLAIAGVSTEGCVVQTVPGALREDYEVYLVVDAPASRLRHPGRGRGGPSNEGWSVARGHR